MSNNGPTASPMPLVDSIEDWPIGSSMEALIRAAEVQQAQAMLNSAQSTSSFPSGSASTTSAAPAPQPHPTVVDQAALNHIINNPRLIALVTERIAAQASHAAPPPETVTRSGRPSRPAADAPVSITDIWASLRPGELERILNDATTLASQSESYDAFPSPASAPDARPPQFMLDPQLAAGGDGAQTFAPTSAPMDLDFWFSLQEEGEDDDPTYVPPSDGHTPAAKSQTPGGGVFTFSPAGDGEFLSSIGLNPDGTTPGASSGQETTSALYAAASPAATSLIELAASPGPFGRPSPGVLRLHPNAAHGSAPSPSPLANPGSISSAPQERSLRVRKKVRLEEPKSPGPSVAATAAKGKGRASSVAGGTSVAGTSAGGSADEGKSGSTSAGPGDGKPPGKRRGRAPVLTKEESAARRSERNKASALASRIRAKKVVEDLETQVAQLTAKVTMLEGELQATRKELQKARQSRPSYVADTVVYYNTPNIYEAGEDGVAPDHPFAHLPPTPVKPSRKRGRPRKSKEGDEGEAKEKDESRSKGKGKSAFAAAPKAAVVSNGTLAPPNSAVSKTSAAAADAAEGPTSQAAAPVDDEEEAQFTDGEAESSSHDGDTEEDVDMDDPDDGDFVETAVLVPPVSPRFAVPSVVAAVPPSSPASTSTVVPDAASDKKKLAPPSPPAAASSAPSSTPATGAHPPSTSDVSDSSGDEDDPSSDRDPDSDFDPTEDLYLPIRDVPHPGPSPDSPPRSVAGPSLATLLASPARTVVGRPGVPPSPLGNVDKTEVVDLLKQLLAKMGGGAGAGSSSTSL